MHAQLAVEMLRREEQREQRERRLARRDGRDRRGRQGVLGVELEQEQVVYACAAPRPQAAGPEEEADRDGESEPVDRQLEEEGVDDARVADLLILPGEHRRVDQKVPQQPREQADHDADAHAEAEERGPVHRRLAHLQRRPRHLHVPLAEAARVRVLELGGEHVDTRVGDHRQPLELSAHLERRRVAVPGRRLVALLEDLNHGRVVQDGEVTQVQQAPVDLGGSACERGLLVIVELRADRLPSISLHQVWSGGEEPAPPREGVA